MGIAGNITFAAEKPLGKLAKWLRILGFDTVYEQDVSSGKFIHPGYQGRILLTRRSRFRDTNASRKLIFIHSNRIVEQLKEVIQSLGLAKENVQPFSRCIRCNTPIEQVEKAHLMAKVPDYIWETQNTFRICSRCRRIYWPGSHTKRTLEMIERVFDSLQ